jgi:outer membrane protein assembly factor BamA
VLKVAILAWVAWFLLPHAAAFAQAPSTRAEADRGRREEKNSGVKPYEPGPLERALNVVENRAVFILDREGFYPKLGSLTTGSGFAYGMGFRDRDLFANKGMLDVWAAASVKQYWAAEARLTFPRLASNRMLVEAWGSRRDYPQENYFGIGPNSIRQNQADYALRTNRLGGRVGVRAATPVLVGAGLEYLEPRVGEGENQRVPDISDQFPPPTVPGLTKAADFVRSSVFVEIDYRVPRNARKGGWYRVDFSHYADRSAGGGFTFNRMDADVRQFVGFFNERRVLAGRLFVSTSDADRDQVMPFYFMPTLGGNDTLRGFREYRFRGPHAILLQGEYRFEIWSGFDAALFYDAGEVANRRGDLDFGDFERDYGIGFRFNTDNGVVFRVDTAFGSADGKHLYIVFGGVF